jgi:hypothetical protein
MLYGIEEYMAEMKAGSILKATQLITRKELKMAGIP